MLQTRTTLLVNYNIKNQASAVGSEEDGYSPYAMAVKSLSRVAVVEGQ